MDIAGAILLLTFSIPPQVALRGHLATNEFEYSEENRRKVRRNRMLAKLGLYMLIAGFALQLLSNYVA